MFFVPVKHTKTPRGIQPQAHIRKPAQLSDQGIADSFVQSFALMLLVCCRQRQSIRLVVIGHPAAAAAS